MSTNITMDVSQLTGLILLSLLILIVGLFFQYYKQRWPVRNFPPGPTGLPILGTFLTSGSKYFSTVTASTLLKRYGNVCSLMLATPVVVVNGYDAINEVTHKNRGYDFASRRDPAYISQLHNPKKLGLFSADFSERLQKHRRFVISTLRLFGVGKASFEGNIKDEVQCALNDLKNLAKVPQDISTLLTVSVANVLCDTLLGCRYDDDDKEFHNVLHVLDKWSKFNGKTKVALLEFVPITRPFLRQSAQDVKDIYDKLSTFTMGKVAEHQKTFKSGSEPRDFIDCYLAKMAEEPDDFTLEELEYDLNDLFTASLDTTANTLKYAILYMILNPNVQEKIHHEVLEVVGTSRLPCLEDRDQMPYTVATIQEVLRLSYIPSVFPRCATVDTTLAGYSIPKGTNVLCNVWGLHHDPDLWPNPERFDPTRHLNDEGEVVKSPYLLPFGAGRRVCMGETLAKMELFLFLSSLLHQFKIEIPLGADVPPTKPVPGFAASPQPFQVVIKEHVRIENVQA